MMSSLSVSLPPPLPDTKETDLVRRELERRLKETVRERLGLPGGSKKLDEDGNVTTSKVVERSQPQQRLHRTPSRDDDLNNTRRPMDQRMLLHNRSKAVEAARSKYAVRRWQQRDRQRRRGREGLTINTPTTEDTTTTAPKVDAPPSSEVATRFAAAAKEGLQFAHVDTTKKQKTKQRYLIGTIVSETHAVQPFVGAIMAYNVTEDKYSVKFEDGELRYMTEEELSKIMVDASYKGRNNNKLLLPPVVDDSSSITDSLTMTGSTFTTSSASFLPPGVSTPGREVVAAKKQDDNVENGDHHQDVVGLSALIQATVEKHRADTIRMLSLCATQGQSCVPSNTMTARRYANLNALAAANQLVYRAGGHKLPYHDLKTLLTNAEEDALSSFQKSEMQQTIDVDHSDRPEELMPSEQEEEETEEKLDEEDSDDEEESSIQEEVESICAWFAPTITDAPPNEAHSTTSDFREKCSVAGSVIGTGAVGGAVVGASIVGAAPLVLVAAVLGASVWGASFLMLVTCNNKSSSQQLPSPNDNSKSRYVAPDRIASSQASCNSSLPSLPPLSYGPPVLEVHWEEDTLTNIAAE